MEPLSFEISYTASGRKRLLRGAFESCAYGDLRVDASLSAGMLEFAVHEVAAEGVVLDGISIRLAHRFAADERVLLGGYQSWTDTHEMGPDGRMRGLRGVPRAVVARWALDASGDYRFVDYENRAGRMHGFTYASFRRGQDVLLLASLDEREGFTLIRVDTQAGTVELRPECPARPLGVGKKYRLRYAVLRGSEGAVYDTWFALAGVQARPAQPLCGYSSWYRHYEQIDEQLLGRDLASAAAAFGCLDACGFVRLFQIDDGWCRKGDWLHPDPAKFPHGMASLAHAAETAGFVPGLWMAPFVAERGSALAAAHPDWLMRGEDGRPLISGSHWGGHYALDTQHPDVRAYIAHCVRTAVQDWGFGLLKLDFLYAACMLPHAGMNRGALMADAMALLRESAGEHALILACGVPLASAFGVADYCRIGCDVGLDWDDAPYMRLLHRERVSTKNSLANTVWRSPLDGRAFACDPDVVFLRDDTRHTPKQRAQLLEVDALFSRVLLTSDDMGAWSSAACASYQRALDVVRAKEGMHGCDGKAVGVQAQGFGS